jgi:hypothetical protein
MEARVSLEEAGQLTEWAEEFLKAAEIYISGL